MSTYDHNHRQLALAITLLVILLSMAICTQLMNPQTRCQRWNVYRSIFREPVETVALIDWDSGEVLEYTTMEELQVHIQDTVLRDSVRGQGFDLSDIDVVIHNHFRPRGFSLRDNQTYHFLCRNGFRGKFGIWYTAMEKARWK